MMDMVSLGGKTVLVTGGSKGIGASMAIGLSEASACWVDSGMFTLDHVVHEPKIFCSESRIGRVNWV
jgi:hypothetical protein